MNKTNKLSLEIIEQLMATWKAEISEETGLITDQTSDRPKPWKKQKLFSKVDVVGKLHIVLGDGIYVDTLNLMPRIQNQIRSMAAFDNPIFYKNKRLGLSNYYNFSAVYMGKDVDGYICIPRGLREELLSAIKTAGIEYDIVDQREKGRLIRVSFDECREKKRSSVIGTLTGNKNTLTGIIDVAMVGSLYSKGNSNEMINSYGWSSWMNAIMQDLPQLLKSFVR